MIDISADPVPGFYRLALRRGAPPSGIRIWFGHSTGPEGQRMVDRSMHWQAEANGKSIDIERVWPVCGKDPISEDDYRYLARSHSYAVENDAWDPRATPGKATDWDTATPPAF